MLRRSLQSSPLSLLSGRQEKENFIRSPPFHHSRKRRHVGPEYRVSSPTKESGKSFDKSLGLGIGSHSPSQGACANAPQVP